jgi:redox-sensitive bicupin YhaK (pirin superfamily)
MKTTLHRADTRGVADHGWLISRHTFSFASYSSPNRMGFGKLRVINDDVVQPSMGFGTHPHENMEIISIPIAGELRHKDSMGNAQHIKEGEVQIMSAGTGVTHSEYNGSDVETVNFLQIWVFPKKQDIEPRYGQQLFSCDDRKNGFQEVVSPDKGNNSDAIWINQDAWFSQGDFDAGYTGGYSIKRPGNGAYFFVIGGAVTIAGEHLERRDGIGIEDADRIDFSATGDCQLLVMDVPM